MKSPAHPGALLRDDIEALGLSIAEAARGIGVTRQQLHKLVKGASAVTPEMAIRLEKAIGSSADTWLRLQANYDLAQLRSRKPELAIRRLGPKAA